MLLYRLSRRFITWSPRFHSRGVAVADDATRVASGYQQRTPEDSHQGWHPSSIRSSARSSIHLCHYAPVTPVGTNSVNSFSLCNFPGQYLVSTANYSTSSDSKGSNPTKETASANKTELVDEDVPEEKLSIFQRFKRAYKQHGKVLVGVHVVTSCVWYGSFYAAARCGLDLVPWMEQWGFSETIVKPFRAGGLGDFALAYLMYKLATPARYTVTLAGTNLVIRHLRSKGKMAPKSQEDSIRQLYKDGRQQIKDSNLRKERLRRLREARERKKAEKWRKGKHF